MSTPASAVTTVDSATTATPVVEQPAFDPSDQHTWSGEQRAHWNETGDIPASPKKSGSATDDKEKTSPDSSTGKEKTSADSASDSATDKSAKPNLKTKEDTEKRFKEILDENKTLQRRVESLERGKGAETRDNKQESQPAPETYKPLDEKEFFRVNPKASYEDFVRAAGKHEGVWAARQEIAAENQRRALAEAQKDLTTRVEEAQKRYPDYQERIQPAVKAITEDAQIPFPVKAVLNDSPVFVDLLYVLAEPKALADLIQTAKTNPAAAIRKIVLTEQLVQAELAKVNGKGKDAAGEGKGGEGSGDGTRRDVSGKFAPSGKSEAASEPKPRAPKPPSEVGGRGTASEDALKTAAAADDFKAFEAEQWRRKRASAS